MRLPLFAMVLLTAGPPGRLTAQTPRADALRDVIAVERAFSHYADTANIPAAFLWALAPDAITLDADGVKPMRPLYVARRPGPALLQWEPSLVDASEDGNFAISTGPWEWRPARDSGVKGRGQFLTVWKKGPERWQVALDLGIGGDSTAHLTGNVRGLPAGRTGHAALEQVLGVERGKVKGNGWVRALRALATPDVRVLREGMALAEGRDALDGSSSARFSSLGGTVSSAGDLGATWGTWRDGSHRGSYVRIWKRTADGWRVILDRMGD